MTFAGAVNLGMALAMLYVGLRVWAWVLDVMHERMHQAKLRSCGCEGCLKEMDR